MEYKCHQPDALDQEVPLREPDTEVEPQIAQALLAWYAQHRRSLPWRSQPTPYRVWVSEVMLQQTRVATVLPYFARWMEALPDLPSLAAAPQEQILELWAGLGYYRRARTLHQAAQVVMQEHGGQLPRDVAGLLSIPGIGRYTAGAIASIAYEVPAPIVDGNVIRILCRIFGLEGDPRARPLEGQLWELAKRLIPSGQARDFNQSMMELGALVCLPRGARCSACPVQRLCQARRQGRVEELPQLKRKKPPRPVLVGVALVERGGRWLLRQRPAEGLFGGLWELPTVELPLHPEAPEGPAEAAAALEQALAALGVQAQVLPERPHPQVVHSLTHLRMHFLPLDAQLQQVSSPPPGQALQWCTLPEMESVAMASAMRKVIQGLRQPSLFT